MNDIKIKTDKSSKDYWYVFADVPTDFGGSKRIMININVRDKVINWASYGDQDKDFVILFAKMLKKAQSMIK